MHGRLMIVALCLVDDDAREFLVNQGFLLKVINEIQEKDELGSWFTPEKATLYPTLVYPPNVKPSSPDEWLNKVLNNDTWAEVDQLGYELYATAITGMIREESNQTKPPLTIAILAPWGQGKTTLMRYVERNFRKLRGTARVDHGAHPEKVTTLRNIINWVKELPVIKQKIDFPTIWFNPWKHQNSEQLWAGMGYAIIKQLVEYLPPTDQEKFWFQLNLKRIDINTLRSQVHKNILNEFIGNFLRGAVVWSVLLGLTVLVAGLLLFADFVMGVSMFTMAAALAPIAIEFFKSRKEVLNESLKDKFTDIVTEPDYEKKTGYFSEVEKDMKHVFDILIDKKKPAVIFIDDLDRCSPDVITEVIEAINLIINSDFSEKCYFVIGMDAKMVAASLDKKYADLVDKFREEKNRFGDIGYYFLDKFIQLPFSLPVLDPDARTKLLNTLFNTAAPKVENQKLNDEQEKIIDNFTRNQANKSEATKILANNLVAQQRFIENRVKQMLTDSGDVVEQLKEFGPYLGSSPRSIKRFVNMFRFYYSYQELRKLQNMPSSSARALAKWLVLSVRCPQMVRFIQWEFEENFVNSNEPKAKAVRFDKLISEFKSKLNGKMPANGDFSLDPEISARWRGAVDDLKVKDFEWLKESDILQLLMRYDRSDDALVKALECNVW